MVKIDDKEINNDLENTINSISTLLGKEYELHDASNKKIYEFLLDASPAHPFDNEDVMKSLCEILMSFGERNPDIDILLDETLSKYFKYYYEEKTKWFDDDEYRSIKMFDDYNIYIQFSRMCIPFSSDTTWKENLRIEVTLSRLKRNETPWET